MEGKFTYERPSVSSVLRDVVPAGSQVERAERVQDVLCEMSETLCTLDQMVQALGGRTIGYSGGKMPPTLPPKSPNEEPCLYERATMLRAHARTITGFLEEVLNRI